MGGGRKSKIVKEAANKGTLHHFYKRTRSGRPRDRYNTLRDNYESTPNLQRSSHSVSKPKTIEQSGSNKARNSGAPKSQSLEQQIRGNKESKSKNPKVHVTMKGVKARIATLSK